MFKEGMPLQIRLRRHFHAIKKPVTSGFLFPDLALAVFVKKRYTLTQ